MRRLPLCLIPLFAVSLFAADFWKTKDPSQWSNDEVTKMLTKSPWAKSFLIQTVGFPAGGDATGGGAIPAGVVAAAGEAEGWSSFACGPGGSPDCRALGRSSTGPGGACPPATLLSRRN